MSDNDSPLLRARWPYSASRPVASPLQPSVVYASDDPDALDAQYEGQINGYTYAREGHPNADVVAQLIDNMEETSGGVVVGSGMAAVSLAILANLKSGDHVVGANQLYGRTLRLMSEELPRLGIASTLADPTDAKAVAEAINDATRMVFIETVSNPTLRVSDLDAIVAVAKDRGVLLAVDNTFTTPRAVKPLGIGADIVIHSVTKLLAGHSDATLGYVASRDSAMNDRMRTLSATLGLTPSPFDCWMAERGLYTFDLRIDQTCATAKALADALSKSPKVKQVLYPGSPDHPDRLAARALKSFGNMVSFEIEGGRQQANAFVRAASRIAFAPTLGDVATTISHPASSSHRALSPEARQALGITEGFFRVSVGCEQAEDLCKTVLSALDVA